LVGFDDWKFTVALVYREKEDFRKLGILTIPGSVVEHLAQCRTLGDLPVEMLPPSQLNQN